MLRKTWLYMRFEMRWMLVGLLMVSGFSSANPQPWMKRVNPDEFGLFVLAGKHCSFTTEKLRSIIEGEFLRARLKPTDYVAFNLTVSATCAKDATAVAYDIRFGTDDMLYEIPTYGGLSTGGSDDYFLKAIKLGVESALTDYMEANFAE